MFAMRAFILLVVLCTSCIGLCFSYDLGKAYSYNYVTEVHINEADPAGSDVGFKLSSVVDLSIVWQSGTEQVAKITVGPFKFVEPMCSHAAILVGCPVYNSTILMPSV